MENGADSYQAVRVIPMQAQSAHLATLANETPGPGQIRLRVIRVGICGTDGEIDRGLYGTAPQGATELVLGHEALGVIDQVGPGVTDWQPGQLAVPIVRRPCPEPCPACLAGRWDLCLTGDYVEHGIKGIDGFLRQYAVVEADAAVPLPPQLEPEGVLVEPLTIVEKAIEEGLKGRPGDFGQRRALVTGAGPVGVLAALLLRQRGWTVWVLDRRPAGSPKAQLLERFGSHYLDDTVTPLEKAAPTAGYDLVIEATGYSPLLFRAAALLAKNGAMVLTGVTSGHHNLTVDSDSLNSGMVLENHVMIGSVNAARHHYLAAVADLLDWSDRWPGLAASLITARYPLPEFRRALDKSPDDIKSVVDISPSHA